MVKADRRGAVAVVIYSDPADYGPSDHHSTNRTFPEDLFLPPGGAQRGSLLETDGDPLTPLYPSKPYTYRSKTEDDLRRDTVMPNIPVTPIGYRDAEKLLRLMNGPVAPAAFRGGIRGLTYRLTSDAVVKVENFVEERPKL